MATTDVEGAYFFWAPADDVCYNIFDVDGKLIGAKVMGADAQANVTKDISLVKQSTDGGEEEEDAAMTTISWVLLGVVIVLVLLLVVMAMKGGSEE